MIRAEHLRCEYLTNPVGVDAKVPHLSWKPTAVNDQSTGVRQSGYRILVASSVSSLTPAKSDLWDSGFVDSHETFGIAYGGKLLAARETAFWKVELFDGQGAVSRWSAVQRWTAGPNWQAKWIQFPAPVHDPHVSDPLDPLPASLLRREFSLSSIPSERCPVQRTKLGDRIAAGHTGLSLTGVYEKGFVFEAMSGTYSIRVPI